MCLCLYLCRSWWRTHSFQPEEKYAEDESEAVTGADAAVKDPDSKAPAWSNGVYEK